MLRALKMMRTATHLPLAAITNAGLPSVIDGRSVYLVSPEDIASFTRKFIQAGASLIGGCCGTTPDHTRAMRLVMQASETEDAAMSWR